MLLYKLRVYYHIMDWKVKGAKMKQEEWVLYILDGKCVLMQTVKHEEPAELTFKHNIL